MNYSTSSDRSEAETAEEGNVVRLSVEPVLERKRHKPTAPPSAPQAATPQPEVHEPEPEPIPVRTAPPAPPTRNEADYLISTFRTAGMILSARGLLAMSLMGAFVLAAEAMWKGDVMSLVALGLYGVSTVAPLVWLESRRGTR